MRGAGWVTERCEYHAFGRTHDLFGFADLVAYRVGYLHPIVALVQVTTSSNMAARRKKVAANEHARRLATVMDIVVMVRTPSGSWRAQRYKGGRWFAWSWARAG